MTTMTQPILDLVEDAPPRAWIRGAGGEQHWLATLDDMSINGRREFNRCWQRIQELEARDGDLTKAEEREYADRYVKAVRLIVPSLKVAEVKALGHERREAVVQAFFSHRTALRVVQRLAEMMAASQSATGAPSSPNSSGTTDAPPSEEGIG